MIKKYILDIFVKIPSKLFNIVVIKEQIEEQLHTKIDIIREHKYMKPLFVEMIHKNLVYVK